MVRLEVSDARSGQRRMYEFDRTEIRIGFRSGLDVSLSGAGGEVRVLLDPARGSTVEPIPGPGAPFLLDGTALTGRMPLRPGARLACGSHEIRFRDLPNAAGSQAGAAPAQGGQEPDPAADPGATRAAARDGARDGYLSLFLAPVRSYLDDSDVSEVLINGPNQIYVERKGKLTRTDVKFLNEEALEAAVRNIARHVGRRFDEDQPRLDARLPDGSRVHAVLPPLARGGTVVAIRKFSKDKLTMPQLVKFGSISPEGARLIETIVRLEKNVIVSGPTSSGKTSVLNVLSSFIAPDERILVIEDASELQLQQEHAVMFETRKPDEHGKGEVTIRDLVHSSLRLRPDRLVVGEIRGGEALDLLQALNTGHAGSMSTIHANGPKDALSRIETCALISGVEIPLFALREQVRSAINVVIHTARLSDGSRKITHVTEVLGIENNEYRVQDLLVFHVDSLAPDGRLIGRHVGKGVLPTFMDEAKLRGMAMDPAWFSAA